VCKCFPSTDPCSEHVVFILVYTANMLYLPCCAYAVIPATHDITLCSGIMSKNQVAASNLPLSAYPDISMFHITTFCLGILSNNSCDLCFSHSMHAQQSFMSKKLQLSRALCQIDVGHPILSCSGNIQRSSSSMRRRTSQFYQTLGMHSLHCQLWCTCSQVR
jgi:hypothetical protein